MTDRISVEIEETSERERKQAEKDAVGLNALREQMVVIEWEAE